MPEDEGFAHLRAVKRFIVRPKRGQHESCRQRRNGRGKGFHAGAIANFGAYAEPKYLCFQEK